MSKRHKAGLGLGLVSCWCVLEVVGGGWRSPSGPTSPSSELLDLQSTESWNSAWPSSSEEENALSVQRARATSHQQPATETHQHTKHDTNTTPTTHLVDIVGKREGARRGCPPLQPCVIVDNEGEPARHAGPEVSAHGACGEGIHI